MQRITTFSDVERELSRFIPESSHVGPYTLDTIKKLMETLGNPQDVVQVIHVAGTSGKTSTAYFIAALLTTAGYKTGLTVSPHMNEINDRTQINLQPLTEREYCQEMTTFLGLVERSGVVPSHFEALVAFSYWVFAKRKVDVAVVEVGLGGLLDGTNIVSRSDKVCVITDIGLDHVEILGDTIGKIAAQKAGIILTGNDVFMHDQAQEIMTAVRTISDNKEATLHVVAPRPDSTVADLPTFQQRNFALAARVVEFVLRREERTPLTDSQITTAAHTYIPGRMEVVNYHDKTLVMDGAHNEQKITALVDAMQQRFGSQGITLLVSFGQNKRTSVQASLELLHRLGSSIIITKFASGQDEARSGMEPSELVQYAQRAGFTSVTIEEDPERALELLAKSDTKVGLVVGSLYLIESLRPIILNQIK